MDKSFNRAKGNIGEVITIQYLEERGFTILETNYTTKLGEIDIIACKGNVIHFVEVKYRKNHNFGLGREAVTYAKRKTIRNVAMSYLQFKKLYDKVDVSFDVADIVGELNDCQIDYLEGCF